MKLAAKFNLVVSVVLLGGFTAASAYSYYTLRKNAEREVLQTAGLMMETALAMRAYTVDEVKPLLTPHMTEQFFPQTVPAYAATQALGRLEREKGRYLYKEAALNPTNPRDLAEGWEAELIAQFRGHNGLEELVGVRKSPAGDVLYIARPIRITNPGCLSCHSTPEQAPQAMRVQYGDSRGFGWQLNEIVGAQIVSVPMSVPLENAQRAFVLFTASLLAIFLVTLIALNVTLNRMVIRPVIALAKSADAVSRAEKNVAEFKVRSRDEIATLAASFQRMRFSLERAMRMLRKR